jgi:hypothetical protein
MEGAEIHTVATAATKVLIIGNEAEFMVIEGISGTDLNTGSIGAVQAGTSGEQPANSTVRLHLPELHLDPSFGAEVGRVLIAASVL